MRIRERFNPRAPCGARLPPRQAPSSMPYFNPCAPCGARRRRFGVARAAAGFQPTRPLRGATPHVLQVSGVGCISTHAPLAGRDITNLCRTLLRMDFNPRAPCGARPFLPTRQCLPKEFQPTRPLRGATAKLLTTLLPLVFQPTRPLRGATFLGAGFLRIILNFNPRAPCGARPILVALGVYKFVFQPTRPLRGATAKVYKSLCTFLR